MAIEQTELNAPIETEIIGNVTFSPDFTKRFLRALCEPPIYGVFYENGLNPKFQAEMEKVNKICKERQICSHGWQHVARVAQNAFFLSDLTQAYFVAKRPEQEEQRRSVFSDANLLLPIFSHDLGYGSENSEWDGDDNKNHAQESAMILDVYASNGRPASAKMIEAKADIFTSAIADKPETLLERANRLSEQSDTATPEEVFPLVAQVADKLDYFHANRTEELSDRPAFFEENPYFFLSDAVSVYRLTKSDSGMQYEVLLKQGYRVPSQTGDIELDFALWCDLAMKHYPDVWNLASAFASICGTKFIISPWQI